MPENEGESENRLLYGGARGPSCLALLYDRFADKIERHILIALAAMSAIGMVLVLADWF